MGRVARGFTTVNDLDGEAGASPAPESAGSAPEDGEAVMGQRFVEAGDGDGGTSQVGHAMLPAPRAHPPLRSFPRTGNAPHSAGPCDFSDFGKFTIGSVGHQAVARARIRFSRSNRWAVAA